MTILVIGATGKVGGHAVDGLLSQGADVRVYVRDPAKARTRFARAAREPGDLDIVAGELTDDDALAGAARDTRAAFLVLGPTGQQAWLAARAIGVLAGAQVPQLLRLSVSGARRDSLGVNQRGHAALDETARAQPIGYTTLRPAVFTTAVTDLADEISSADGWTGSAPRGRNPLIDPRDVGACAAAVLLQGRWWGQHLDLTGPALYSWPEVAALLTSELGRPITYWPGDEDAVRSDTLRRGLPEAFAEVLVARDRAVEAGENELLTDLVQRLTGAVPRTLAAYLHEHRSEFQPGLPVAADNP
jgi:NAD(P)H dehydrogenase (quinone)